MLLGIDLGWWVPGRTRVAFVDLPGTRLGLVPLVPCRRCQANCAALAGVPAFRRVSHQGLPTSLNFLKKRRLAHTTAVLLGVPWRRAAAVGESQQHGP